MQNITPLAKIRKSEFIRQTTQRGLLTRSSGYISRAAEACKVLLLEKYKAAGGVDPFPIMPKLFIYSWDVPSLLSEAETFLNKKECGKSEEVGAES